MTALTRKELLKELQEMMQKYVDTDLPNGTPRQKEKRKLFYMGALGSMFGSPYTVPLLEASGALKRKKPRKRKKVARKGKKP